MRTLKNYLLIPAGLATLAVTGLLLNPHHVQAANVADPASSAVQAKVTFTLVQGVVLSGAGLYVVPNGKRVVIEYASAQCLLPAGQAIGFQITTFLGGAFMDHYSAMSPVSGSGIAQTGEKVLLYSDTGGTMNANLMRTAQDGNATCTVAISGHLVDFP